jgi:hypothetical protein
VFERRVPTEIFAYKWEEVRGDWRKLHNEELQDLCSIFMKFGFSIICPENSSLIKT